MVRAGADGNASDRRGVYDWRESLLAEARREPWPVTSRRRPRRRSSSAEQTIIAITQRRSWARLATVTGYRNRTMRLRNASFFTSFESQLRRRILRAIHR